MGAGLRYVCRVPSVKQRRLRQPDLLSVSALRQPAPQRMQPDLERRQLALRIIERQRNVAVDDLLYAAVLDR